MKPELRTAVYGVTAAVLAVLVAYGLVSQDESELWSSVVTQVAGLVAAVVAWLHRPTKK